MLTSSSISLYYKIEDTPFSFNLYSLLYLKKMEAQGSQSGQPSSTVKITDCGELV